MSQGEERSLLSVSAYEVFVSVTLVAMFALGFTTARQLDKHDPVVKDRTVQEGKPQCLWLDESAGSP